MTHPLGKASEEGRQENNAEEGEKSQEGKGGKDEIEALTASRPAIANDRAMPGWWVWLARVQMPSLRNRGHHLT
jgi:hypothetical protein